MKCTRCSYKEIIDFDMISDLWYESICDYPEFECPKCGHKKSSGVLIPIDIFNKINNM